MIRVLVLRSAGTNCDEETAHAFRLAGAEVERVHLGAFLRGERTLDEFHVLAFAGGFSYGDDLGAGTVLATKLRTRLEDALEGFVASKRLVVGICNGFQVLVRLGLLPGWKGEEKSVSLVENHSGKFEDRWVHLRVESSLSPFLRPSESPALPRVPSCSCRSGNGPGLHLGRVFRLPVAHKEGRFVVRDPGVLERLEARGQIALRYVEEAPAQGVAGSYPANPNGSTGSIAGITNEVGNVLGLMPHPERHLRVCHDPRWTRRFPPGTLPLDEERGGDGFSFFEDAVRHAELALRGGSGA